MAGLVEVSQWEDEIYQLETTDPVEGGPNGIDNKQAKQLGNRTQFLKDKFDPEKSPNPLTQYLLKTDYDNDQSQQFSRLLNLPIYPEVLTESNILNLDFVGTTLTVSENQTLRLRGWFDVNTSNIDEANRQFVVDLVKTYHLRYDQENGFRLVDLSDITYNPDALAHSDVAFDSTFDDVLLAVVETGVITSYINIPDIPKGVFAYAETVESYAITSTNVEVLTLSAVNNYARSIKCRLTSNFTLSDNTGANQGYGIVRQDGVDIYKSRRIHVGNSNGYLYNVTDEFTTEVVLSRRAFLFGLYLTNEVNAPWFNTAWEWPTTPTTTYLKVEAIECLQ